MQLELCEEVDEATGDLLSHPITDEETLWEAAKFLSLSQAQKSSKNRTKVAKKVPQKALMKVPKVPKNRPMLGGIP